MQKFIFTLLLFLIISVAVKAQDTPIVLVGGTIIDVTNYGNSIHDISNSVVVIEHGKIIAAGAKGAVKIPRGAKIISAAGKYIVPGLIDCFSVIGKQGQANSHLYYGVTTVVAGPGDDRRKGYFPNGNPSPHIKMLVTIPSDALEDELEKIWTLTPESIAKVDREIDHIDSYTKPVCGRFYCSICFPKNCCQKWRRNVKNTVSIRSVRSSMRVTAPE